MIYYKNLFTNVSVQLFIRTKYEIECLNVQMFMRLFLSYEKCNYLLQTLRNITCIYIQITRRGGGGAVQIFEKLSSLPNIYAYEYFVHDLLQHGLLIK